jgi:site-specific recombinase XerD
MEDNIPTDQTITDNEINFESQIDKAKSEETQRLIRFLTHAVRKHQINQPTLRYIYRTVIRRANLAVPKKQKNLYRLPTISELDAFFAVIDDPQELLLFQLMLSTGARCAEITSITCNNINYEANTILIRGKGSKERNLVLTPKMAERIKFFLAGHEKNRKYLFMTRLFKPYSVRRVEQLCQGFKKAAKIDAKWTPHGLRHYQLSHLSGTSNLSLSIVQRVAGHENLQTTQIYQNLGLDGSKDLVLEKLKELENKNILK